MNAVRRRRSLRSRGLLVVGLPLVALLLTASLFLLVVSEGQSAQRWVEHTRQVQSQLQQISTLRNDVQSANSGYLLTGNSGYLTQSTSAATSLSAATVSLENLVRDNPVELARATALRGLVDNYSALPSQLNERSPRLQTWLAHELAASDAVHSSVAQMIRTEDSLLKQRLGRFQFWQDFGLAAAITLVIVGGLLGIMGSSIFSRSILRRVRRLGELSELMDSGDEIPEPDDQPDELGELSRRITEVGLNIRRRESEIDQARAFLNQLVTSGSAVFTRATLDGTITFVSDNSLRIMGIAPATLQARGGIREWLSQDDARRIETTMRELGDPHNESPANAHLTVEVHTDRHRLLELHVTRVHIDGEAQLQGMWLDVTVEREAQRGIAEREARLAALIEANPDTLYIIDDELRIQWISRPSRVGIDAHAAANVGAELTEIILTEQRSEFRRQLEDVRDGRLRESTARYRSGRGSKAERVLEMRTRRVNGWANTGRILVVCRDVSEQDALLTEIQEARALADSANLAKSRFLSRMSHELRTPLNAVLGFAQLLEMDALAANQADAVHQIRRAGVHLLDLINEVLDIARIESGELTLSTEFVLVSDAVSEVTDLVQPLAVERGVSITFAHEDECRYHVRADRQRIKQILLNLLSNAIKYNRHGGSILLSCEVTDEGSLALTVADTGIGMIDSDVGRLFTPFERLGAEASDVEGTGVGLALSQGLARAMGGRIEATSTVGVGSAFTLTLPLAVSDHPSPARDDRQPSLGPSEGADDGAEIATPSTTRAITILYIEDNLANWRLVDQVVTRRGGGRLLHALQGRRGLELATANLPDLILLDLHLPDMSGEEVLRRLRAEQSTHAIPVVIVSADASSGQSRRLMNLGADGYLTKPLDLVELLSWINNPQRHIERSSEPGGVDAG
ncbi:MAG TPA: ATP-binding protein [Acidimicrobiales bacterium]|nr:ATP-binding protein [Acidimicrobiales bacterium]